MMVFVSFLFSNMFLSDLVLDDRYQSKKSEGLNWTKMNTSNSVGRFLPGHHGIKGLSNNIRYVHF